MPSRRLMLFTLILLAGVFPPGPAPAHPVWIVEMAADPLARTVSGEGPAAGRNVRHARCSGFSLTPVVTRC